MRIREIIFEDNIVKNNTKPRPDQEMALKAAHRVAGTADRHYDLNRVMMCAAGSDGRMIPKVDVQSWAGKNNIAIPYTRVESEMLKRAYEAMGVDWDDVLKPNQQEKSLETADVQKTSPVPRRKTNKYGV